MTYNILETLVEESQDINNPYSPTINPNAYTVSMYKSITNLIYTELVGVTETKTRIANVFCWEHVDSNDTIIVNTPTTYSGLFGVKEREELKEEGNVFPTKESYSKGDYFIDENDIVYQATEDNPFEGVNTTNPNEKLARAFWNGTIRYATDASNEDGIEPTESAFKMRSWRGHVLNRRTKLDTTTELLQDLHAILGSDANQTVIDSIAMVIADDINKDIIHKLQCVSSRFLSEKYNFKPYIDFSKDKRDDFIIGRELYAVITDMIAEVTSNTKFTPNYVVVSPRVAGKINSSGMSVADSRDKLKSLQDRYILNDGTLMLVDVTAKFDYIMVGVNNKNASSLYMSNFVQNVSFKGGDKMNDADSIKLGTYNIFRVTNPNSLSDSYMCLSRYALTSPPYTYPNDEDSKIVYGDDWEKLANKSPLSMLIGVRLPKIQTEK